MASISGHVYCHEGPRGVVWRAKYRLPDGRQVHRTIGQRPWRTELPRPAAGDHRPRGRGRAALQRRDQRPARAVGRSPPGPRRAPRARSWDGHRERDDADRRRLRLKTAQGDADDRCRGFRSHRSSNRLRQYLPDSLADTLIVVGGVAVAAAIVAGFATGVCEVVALLGGGYATAAAIAFPLSRAGVRDTPSRARWPPPPQARARPRPLHSPSRSAPPRDCGERTRRRLAVSAPEPSGEPAESASRGAHTRAR